MNYLFVLVNRNEVLLDALDEEVSLKELVNAAHPTTDPMKAFHHLSFAPRRFLKDSEKEKQAQGRRASMLPLQVTTDQSKLLLVTVGLR